MNTPNPTPPRNLNPTTPWCKRVGHHRICLTCGQNIKKKPDGCGCPNHWKSFERKRAYNREYFQRHKERLVAANARYRRNNPAARQWMRKYGRKWYRNNRQLKLAKNQAWEQLNRSQRVPYLRRKASQWYHDHPERARQNNQRWYAENKTQKNARRNKLIKDQRARDPGARVRFNMRVRLSTLLRNTGKKYFSISRDVLLYSAAELRAHLEKLFTPEMNWENYGTYWEVDHIIECVRFDLTKLEQCRQCFGLENLRPLELKLNRGRYHHKR